MKIVIFTSNAIRHKFVANTLTQHADEVLVVSECRKSDAPPSIETHMTDLEKSFAERYRIEQIYFKDNDVFLGKTLPLEQKEVSLPATHETVKRFGPDMGFVFGSSIIRDPLLSLIPPGKFVNMHLGLSPYYRGSGTNFWPFVNEELEYVGATILHIDAGVDTGDIICHVRPTIETGDTVHSIGCKTIKAGTDALVACLEKVKKGQALPRVKQWDIPSSKYYRNKDVNDKIIAKYHHNLENGLIEKHLAKEQHPLELIELN